MRVLHVGKYYPPVPGGMETVLQLLCEGERQRIDSSAIVANTSPVTVREAPGGVPLTRVASLGRLWSVPLCPSFPVRLKDAHSDVLVLHEPNTLALVSHSLVRPGARLVVWFHSEVVRQRWLYCAHRPFLLRALRLADRIVVSSPSLLDHAAELGPFRTKCAIIPFGIDIDGLSCSGATAERVEALRLRCRLPTILFVGRLVGYKGADVLLRALRGIAATAILVGEGPLRRPLEALSVKLGIAGRVVFAGNVPRPELVALYHACDVFVLPSVTRNEAFGIVQLEAMACGKPVVNTDLPSGVPWVNQHGITGLTVSPGDVEGLRNALSLLISDPDQRKVLGARGRERVLAGFTRERMVASTVRLYEEVLSQSRGGR